MKYNVGDRFVIEIEKEYEASGLYKVKGLNNLFNEYTFDKLAGQEYKGYIDRMNELASVRDQSYNKGLADAWELASKVFFDSDLGGFESSEIKEIFGTVYAAECFKGDIHKAIKKYKEMQNNVDWSTVEVDTPILVKMERGTEWTKRHFAKYENGKVYAWRDGSTSWSSHPDDVYGWDNAKLPEE